MDIVTNFKESIPKKILGVRTVALIEIIVFYSLLVLYDIFYGNGDRFFSNSLHPFYFMVLLVTVQYGTVEGIAATLIGTICLFSGNFPQQTVEESLFEYQFRLSIQPLIWFASAFILGEIRGRLESEKDEYKVEATMLQDQSNIISKEYEVLKLTKENLEAYLVSQQQSIANTYKAIRGLEILKPSQVLSNLETVVMSALRVKKFSVFAAGENGLEVAQSHGWDEKDGFMLRIVCDEPLFQEITVEKKVLCIVNEHDEKTLNHQGVLAGPLIDVDKDEVFGMLKIEEMNFMELNISSIEAFKGLCELIGLAYSNASKHKELKSHSIYDVDYQGLLTYHLFEVQRDFLKELCSQLHQPLHEILITYQEKKTREVEKMLSSELNEAIKLILPKTAQVFLGNHNVGNLLILLPSTDLQEGNDVVNKVLQQIDSHELLRESKVNIQLKPIFIPEDIGHIEDEQELSKN